MRSVLSWALCALTLVTGLVTAALSSANRARGDELDRLERWCEAQSRRNELVRLSIQRSEWDLLGGGDPFDAREERVLAGSVAP